MPNLTHTGSLTHIGSPGDARAGRPRRTSRGEVARVALELFAQRGFDETTLEQIAAAAGIGRRTLFRYYGSKNDLVWGEFDEHVEELRARLRAADPDLPVMEVIRDCIVAFNDYGEAEQPVLRLRMRLVTSVPALQGHAMLRYARWSDAVAEFVAARTGATAHDHLPQVIAGAALGTAMATYRHWIEHPEADLLRGLDRAFTLLAAGFPDKALAG